MIHPIQIINAVAVDEKHLELKEPLSKEAGKKFKIAIILEQQNREQTLERLEKAYLSMSDDERKSESELAEEGIFASPDLDDHLEESDKWWE